MIVDLNAPIEVNTFGFNIPSREFVISAQITRDKRMPLVDEFVLRTLNIVGKISVARLARFFTFDGPELGIALADLQARSLVVLEGEDVSLHSTAKELFRAASDKEHPTIATVEEFHASVWFDLISQGLIARKGPHNARNLIALKTGRSDLNVGEDFARAAFDENFHDYLRRVRNIKNADGWSLYSILDVQTGRYSYSPWPAREVLVPGTNPRLEPILVSDEENRTPRLRRLMTAMADELQAIGPPPSSAAAREEYGRLLGSDSLRKAVQGDGYFDLPQWLATQYGQDMGPTAAVIGYPYLQRNVRQLTNALLSGNAKAGPGPVEVFWFRPGGTAWGMTEDLNACLRELRASLRQLGAARVSTTLLVPSSVPPRVTRAFDRIFDRGFQVPPNRLPASLEILLIPQLATVVCAGVSLSSSVDIPIGTSTVERNLLKRVEERLSLQELLRASTLLWPRGRGSSEKSADADLEGEGAAGSPRAA